MAFIKIRLENREGIHNKFYEMTLTSGPSGHTEVEIYSGRINVTRVCQSGQKDTRDGWSSWREGYQWFLKQLKKKVGNKKEYDLREIKASADAIESEVQNIADEFGSERKKFEAATEYITAHWW